MEFHKPLSSSSDYYGLDMKCPSRAYVLTAL